MPIIGLLITRCSRLSRGHHRHRLQPSLLHRPRHALNAKGRPIPRPDLLKEITAETLQHEDGIEGGFYAARADALIGYAFPTHEGPGPEKGMPERERPTIENLAREAVAANAIKTFRFEGPHDAILFVAVPIHEQSSEPRPLGLRMKSRAPCGLWSGFPESKADRVANSYLEVSGSASLH